LFAKKGKSRVLRLLTNGSYLEACRSWYAERDQFVFSIVIFTDFEIAAAIRACGRPAFDPQPLISLWVYAYSQGIGSAREVARRCE